MIDLNEYDNEGKQEVFFNEDEEIVSKKEDIESHRSKGIIDEAEEEENSNGEGSENSDENDPAKGDNGYEGYMIEGNEDMKDLLAQEEENNTRIDKINELLFCCQGIGKTVLNNKQKLIYEKNEYCIPSLKDIHRFLRNDSKETQLFKRAILNWQILETDFIPCLINNEDDPKISQMILVILVDLTEELDDNVDGRKELESSLSKFNELLIKGGVIDFISRKLNSATEEFNRAKILKEKYKQIEIEEMKKEKEKEKEKQKIKEEDNKDDEDNKDNDNNNKDNKDKDDNNKGNKNNDGDDDDKIVEDKKEDNDNNSNIDEDKSNNNNNNEENKVDKKLDTSQERKRILLQQITQMEYKSKNMIELLLVLLKQIISIANSSDLNDTSKICSLLLIKFTELKLFDALLYYISTFNDIEKYPFTKEILAPHLLSILYYVTRLFTPKSIINLSSRVISNKHGTINENEGKELFRLAELERQEFQQRKMLFSSRGNTYNFKVRIERPIDKSSYFVNNMNQIVNKSTANYVKEKTNTFKNQRHGPRYRKKNIFRDKNIPKSVVISEIKMINDTKIKNYFSEKSSEISSDDFNPAIVEIKKFLVQLMESNSFNCLIDFYYFKFDKEYELEKYDLYYLINIMAFFIEFNRLLNYNDNKEGNNNNNNNNTKKNFNFKRIALCLSSNMITYMYNFLYTEITKTDKEERKGFVLFPLLNYLKQAVYALMDSYRFSQNNLSEEHDSFNLTINVMIQDALLTKDYTKVIEKFFEIYNELYYPIDYLYDIIEFSEIYYSALEYFLQKRELKIKTKKRKKKKKKAKKEKEEDEVKEILKHLDKVQKKYETEDLDENFNPIKKEKEKDEASQENNEDESNSYGENDYSDDDEDDSEDSKDNVIIRDINVSDEAKCLVNYSIINKIFSIFKNVSGTLIDNFDLSKKLIEIKNNKRGILKYIMKLFERIAIKTKCFWIFFNIEYMVLFNRLLNDQFFRNEPAYKLFKDVIEKIVDEYFSVFKKNKILPIECLFHIEGLSLVEAIMNNYEYPEDKVASNYNKHYYGGITKKNELEGFISDEDNKGEDEGDENKNENDSQEEEYYKPGETELFSGKKEEKKKKLKKNKNKIKKEEEIEDNENNEDKNENENDEKNVIEWSEEMDKKLMDYYFANIDKDRTNIDAIVEDLIEVELKDFNIDFKKKDIRQRLHKLKVKKGQKRAMKKFNKIHHISDSMDIDSDHSKNNEKEKHKHKHKHKKNKDNNTKYNSDSISNYIYKLSDKSKEIEYKTQLENCFNFIKDQLISYKKKINILGDTTNDNEKDNIKCELIPTSTEDMNILKDEDFKNLLFSVGFYYDNDTEYLTLKSDKNDDIDLINENIELYKNIIEENVEQDKSVENERKEQKEKYNEMQKKKHNNSKKLIDYIMTEEEMKTQREKEMENIEEMSDKYSVMKTNSNKKKKKLVKKKINDLDSIQEESEKHGETQNKNVNEANDEDVEIKDNN